ncbi:zf-HC2 domain-containing protein [bacterium]|nr:zf-HC2 domain-containing protein [bacterium]
MECKIVRDNLIAMRDDELDSTLKEEILNHLSSCKECRTEQKAIVSFFESYGKLEQLKLSEDYMDSLFCKCGINTKKNYSSIIRNISLAAAVVLMIFSYFIYNSENESSYMELMKISKSVKESLKNVSSLENIKLYGQCINKINFKNSNFQRVEFLVSKNENSSRYELIEITNGKKEILYSRNNPFNIEFSMKGRSRLDYNIRLDSEKNTESIQFNSVLFLNNTGI